jgi:DNA-binding phage protein
MNGKCPSILDVEEVIQLLRAAVEQEGNRHAFARKTGISRSFINMILSGKRPPPDSVLKVLKLHRVFTPE